MESKCDLHGRRHRKACTTGRRTLPNPPRAHNSREPGDQIFFYPKDGIGGSTIQHTGLVYAVDSSYVYTIEGNTSGANGVISNGGGVCKKKYKLTYERLAGFGRPVWGTTSTSSSTSASAATTPAPAKSTSKFPAGTKVVEITAKSVNARIGDSTKYSSIGIVRKDETYEWVATSPVSGWHAIRMSKQICWVSPKYSKIVTV